MDRFHKGSVYLLIILSVSVSFEIYHVLALPSPSRNLIVTPGGMVKGCRAFVVKDGSQAVDLDGFTGDNRLVTGSDTSVIQDALNNLLDAGRTQKERLCIMGAFTVAGISIPALTILDLSNAYLTLAASQPVNTYILTAGANTNDVEIRSGILDGNTASQTNVNDNILVNGNRWIIDSVESINSKQNGITVNQGYNDTWITNDYFSNNVNFGISLAFNNFRIHVLQNRLLTAHFDAIFGSKTQLSIIEGNEIQSWTDACILFDPAWNDTISFNFCDGTGSGGSASGIVIHKSTLYGPGHGNVISGNIVTRGAGASGSGLVLDTGTYLNTVQSNTLSYNSQHGILLNSNAYRNTLVGNVLKSNTLDGFSLNGNVTNNVFDANIIIGNGRDGIDITNTNDLNNTFTNNYLFGNVANVAFQGSGANPTGLLFTGNLGFNPIGNIAFPFDNTNNQIGFHNGANTITASKTYTCVISSIIVIVTGGTGVGVTIDGSSANYVSSSSNTYILLPGDTINFGGFSGAPTFSVRGL